MKIFTEIGELLGKKIYKDKRLERLSEKFSSEKITFYNVEFTNQKKEACDCIVLKEDNKLDVILEDLEKAENLRQKGKDGLILKIIDILNSGKFLNEELNDDEINSIKEYGFITTKPIVFFKENLDDLFSEIFEKSLSIFFYTAGKKESKAYLIKKNTDIVNAAGKIHSDFARGFIRAEIYNVADLDKFNNFEEAKIKGILKIVDRDYIVSDGDVLNIKFKI